ncbi:MAG: nucleoside phosphorylase [Pseudoalteromonas distincta]
MKILILEDTSEKASLIIEQITLIDLTIEVTLCEDVHKFTKLSSANEYHLIIVDLLVPQYANAAPVDATDQIIDTIRDHNCPNFRTPVIALTSFSDAAAENYDVLNRKDISVITFSNDSFSWAEPLKSKIISCTPPPTYEFVIICALPKETIGFSQAGYILGPTKVVHNFDCRELNISGAQGVVITLPRMGLVNCAITSSRAIDLFQPKIICMSGICAGFKSRTSIYDVIISQICHQHDFGKWGENGFEPEPYSVQLLHDTELIIKQIIADDLFTENLGSGVNLSRSEFPPEAETLNFKVLCGPTSSGSAVIANESMSGIITDQHRKATAFEMEAFALYESARLAAGKVDYFSAKSVVDNGDNHKGDNYHRVACILAARTTHEIISKLIKTKYCS